MYKHIIKNLSSIMVLIIFSFLIKDAHAIDSTLTKNQINSYRKKAYKYLRYDGDSCSIIANEVLAIGKESKDSRVLQEAYWLLGLHQQFFGSFDSAIDLYRNGINFIDVENDSFSFIQFNRQIGTLFFEHAKYDSSLVYFKKSIDLAKNSSNKEFIALSKKCELDIGNILFYKNEFEQCREIADRVLIYFESHKEEITLMDKISLYTLLGNVYSEFKDKKARMFYQKSLDAAKALNNNYRIGISLANLGNYYGKLHYNDSALIILKQSLPLIEPYGNSNALAAININIGECLLNFDQYRKASLHLKKGVSLATELDELQFATNGLKQLIKLYETINKFDSALIFSKELSRLNQNFYNNKLAKERERLLTEYKLDLKNQENAKLLKEKELTDKLIVSKDNYNYLLKVILLLCLLISVSLLYYYVKLKKKSKVITQKSKIIDDKNLELENLNKRQREIISIMSHDLRTPIGQILFLQKELSSNSISDEQRKTFNESIIKSIENGLSMLEGLLLWTSLYLKGDLRINEVNIVIVVQKAIEQLESAANEKNITISNEIGFQQVKGVDEMVLIIVRNMLSNAIKFSLVNNTIRVYTKEIDQHIHIVVSDQGKGMDEKTMLAINSTEKVKVSSSRGTKGEKGAGLGLQISKDFALKMNGRLFVDKSDENGTDIVLSLEASNPSN